MSTLFENFVRWFFTPQCPRLAATLRIGFGVMYLIILWDFYPSMPMLFGHSGLFGTMSSGYINTSNPFHALYLLESDFALEVWFWSSIFFAVLTVLGVFSRVSLILSFISLILFQLRDPWMLYGLDKAIKMCGLWLLFTDTGQAWSVDAWWKRKKTVALRTQVSGWPIRAFQMQVAIVYGWAGLNKLGKEPWLDGSALYYALQVEECNHIFFPQLLEQKELLAYLGYGALSIEILFPLLVFYLPTRKLALISIVALHIGIDIFMHIRLFSTTMYFTFLCFTEPAKWRLPQLALRRPWFWRRTSSA